ncbi:hypothetical protein [Microbacterium gorillae]|uniref:hypothetical protein n=1 Tax=Microbacterium gorillae TaxID=1231063 RepID=UPI000694C77D|nr:hypothetical protein [Microbacterium gorillae]
MTQNDRVRHLAYAGAGAVVFVALLIAGFGAVSFVTRTDVITVGELGPFPGALGVALATVAWFAVAVTTAARRPGLGTAVVAGLVAAAVHLLAVTVTIAPLGLVDAGAAATHLVVGGFTPVVFVAGLLAEVGVAVALRSPGPTARWPWEKHDDE